MRYLLAFLALIALPAAAHAAGCATVVVTKATVADIPKLQADADCFGMIEAQQDATAAAARKAQASARASRKYREARIAELKLPPVPVVVQPVPSPSLEGAAPLHAAFDVALGLKPAWGTGDIPGIYNSEEGAFRFTCGGDGPLAYDDPLLFPGQPGKSHLHDVWGNTEFNAYLTPAKLAANTDSNCNAGDFTLNRSSYWMPALVNDQGQVIKPDLVSVYYKRKTSASRFCTAGSGVTMGVCVGLPNGIRFIFGWNSLDPAAKVQGASWYCTKGDGKHYADLDAVFNSGCVAGAQLIADTVAPNCWDGKNLDTADHRSHMAYGSYGQWGYYKCPTTHPYVIPQEENKASWTVTADMIGTNPDGTHFSRIELSSDHMLSGAKPGQTIHADYMEAWVAEAKAMWLGNCIEKGLDCSGGDLGNGKQLIGASQPSYGWVNPNPREAVP